MSTPITQLTSGDTPIVDAAAIQKPDIYYLREMRFTPDPWSVYTPDPEDVVFWPCRNIDRALSGVERLIHRAVFSLWDDGQPAGDYVDITIHLRAEQLDGPGQSVYLLSVATAASSEDAVGVQNRTHTPPRLPRPIIITPDS